ncbi:hypothetical protein Glove_13g190 [Diversispora epigaea]|uniref:Uncharacterized protein n=1 Tax=Diversispora epigaea TaxID=1348612 RepID=A0A397JMI2_9GLOM|nr:hypothetical protein Glove_13g190 [Diversispora epigaea]
MIEVVIEVVTEVVIEMVIEVVIEIVIEVVIEVEVEITVNVFVQIFGHGKKTFGLQKMILVCEGDDDYNYSGDGVGINGFSVIACHGDSFGFIGSYENKNKSSKATKDAI